MGGFFMLHEGGGVLCYGCLIIAFFCAECSFFSVAAFIKK